MKDREGNPFDIAIFADARVVTTSQKSPAGARGGRGFWRQTGDSLLVIYTSGWTDRIRLDGEKMARVEGFAVGTDLSAAATEQDTANRISGPHADFVGVWRMNKEPDGAFLYIVLQSSGKCYSTINGITEGSWENSPRGATCRWPDGWVDVISRVDGGFQKSSWPSADKLDETASDMTPALRVGSTPFAIAP